MIDSIHLRHFKCFESIDLHLGGLTILTGMNAGGKSSIIQSLVLLHQSIREAPHEAGLRLNGDDVTLGTVGDVLDTESGRSEFSIGLNTGGGLHSFTFDATERAYLYAPLSIRQSPKVTNKYLRDGGLIPQNSTSLLDSWSGTATALKEIIYISTERVGPRETYSLDPSGDESIRLGARGEYTAGLLESRGDQPIPHALCFPEIPPTLARQAEAWLASFFPGAGLEAKRITGTGLATLRLRTSLGAPFHRPHNVGYGLTHVLPVLVGGLICGSNQLLIVENPEAHLHPSAQCKIGRFLGVLANSGVQVLIETHSDHVLNGIRRMVKERALNSQSVNIHFFNARPRCLEDPPQVTSLSIDGSGKIDEWPIGFFDQYEQDLDALTSWD